MERFRILVGGVTLLLLILVALTFSFSGEYAWAQSTTSDGKIPLRVEPLDDDEEKQPPITLRLVEDLSFGKIVAGGRRGGAVVIDAATGGRTVRGGVVELGGRYGRAEFIVRGAPNTRFRISYPGTVDMRGESGRAILTDIKTVPERIGTLGRNGEALILVGATLELKSNQPSGRYQGSFSTRVEAEDD